jgi:hypothetical protein
MHAAAAVAMSTHDMQKARQYIREQTCRFAAEYPASVQPWSLQGVMCTAGNFLLTGGASSNMQQHAPYTHTELLLAELACIQQQAGTAALGKLCRRANAKNAAQLALHFCCFVAATLLCKGHAWQQLLCMHMHALQLPKH